MQVPGYPRRMPVPATRDDCVLDVERALRSIGPDEVADNLLRPRGTDRLHVVQRNRVHATDDPHDRDGRADHSGGQYNKQTVDLERAGIHLCCLRIVMSKFFTMLLYMAHTTAV